MILKIYFLISLASSFGFSQAIMHIHDDLPKFSNNGNTLTGVATPSLGAHDTEVWHSSIAVGSKTPIHTHESQEIVILLNGTLKATVDNNVSICTGPCTIILPANKTHQLENIGQIPTNHYSIVRSQSKIHDHNNNEMYLPWRK